VVTPAHRPHPDLSEQACKVKSPNTEVCEFEAVLYIFKNCGNISVALCPCSWTHSDHPQLRTSSLLVTQIVPSQVFQLFTATLYEGPWEVLPLFHISIPHLISALARCTANKSTYVTLVICRRCRKHDIN